jgi:very-short-patch-repair endonuclease
MRLGFEVISGFRFTEHGMRPSSREAQAEKDGEVLAKLTYGHAATLWRINLGWTRRANPNQFGFMLDVERGYWARNEVANDDNEPPDPMAPRLERVIPYVEDRRNCLVLAPNGFAGEKEMPSLQSVLKNAIQIYFQLEENEIAAEPLPSRDDRRAILFYESAEGGAGVLRRLLDDPKTLQQVAKTALDLCHFDPETGADKRRPPRSKEDCEAACYDCLMSYGNQRDHAFLDRMVLKGYLLALAGGTVVASPGPMPRADHLERLKRASETGLEKKWLDFLEKNALRLPTHPQKLIRECGTRPDYLYADGGNQAAIYVDGPVHEFPDRHERDTRIEEAMVDRGYLVIRFKEYEDWGAKVSKHPSIFGGMK